MVTYPLDADALSYAQERGVVPTQAPILESWERSRVFGARVALVVGDVVGHGVHAAATMGRLRTAVHNFASLDLPPEDLLTHLDDLVARLGQEVAGATCVYAVYDPTSGVCTLARAGHPPPVLVRDDGTAAYADVPAGPPLGLGGLPFETREVTVPAGSKLVLYTDGLVERREADIEAGLARLADAVAASAPLPPTRPAPPSSTP
jgi:serine phosphatase RsbU (regulator of sigma subunit)